MKSENNKGKAKDNELVVRVEIVLCESTKRAELIVCPCTACKHTHCVAEGTRFCSKAED